MEADKASLTQKTYNLAAISFTPAELADEIRKHVPELKVEYHPDFRQDIAVNWPRRLDDSQVQTSLLFLLFLLKKKKKKRKQGEWQQEK